MYKYRQFQTGWFFIVSFLILLVWIIYVYIYQIGNQPITESAFLISTLILVLCFFFFNSMTVIIDEYYIRVKFGAVLFMKKIPVDEILEIKKAKSQWYYGLGIRLVPNGVLYNIHGLNVVEIRLKNKKRIIKIGTDKSYTLYEEIEKRLKNR